MGGRGPPIMNHIHANDDNARAKINKLVGNEESCPITKHLVDMRTNILKSIRGRGGREHRPLQ